MTHAEYPTARCLYCEAPLTGKRRQAIYCDDLCGRAYRDSHVHLRDAAQEFWKRFRSVSRNVRRSA